MTPMYEGARSSLAFNNAGHKRLAARHSDRVSAAAMHLTARCYAGGAAAPKGPRACSLCWRLTVNVHSLATDCKLLSACAVHFPASLVVQFAVHAAWRRGADGTDALHAMKTPPINTAFAD